METKHSKVRQQQRGISPLMLQAILLYGEEVHQHDGATRLIMTKKGYKRLMSDLKLMHDKSTKLKDLFLVEQDNTILTVGYKNKPVYIK